MKGLFRDAVDGRGYRESWDKMWLCLVRDSEDDVCEI